MHSSSSKNEGYLRPISVPSPPSHTTSPSSSQHTPLSGKNIRRSVLSCVAYSSASILMILSNKAMFSILDFKQPSILMLFQNTCAVVIVLLLRYFKYLDFPSLDSTLIRKWLPLNILFLAMIWTGAQSIKLMSVPLQTIIKNMSSVFTTLGDSIFYGQTLSLGVLFSFSMMLVGPILGCLGDFSLTWQGFFWTILNACVTTAYTLYMKRLTMQFPKLGSVGAAFTNNLISIPLILILSLATGELPNFLSTLSLSSSAAASSTHKAIDSSISSYDMLPMSSILWLMINGIAPAFLGIATFFCMRETSPTTYSMVGSVSKVPVTVLSIFLFADHFSSIGAVGVMMGLFGGIIYSVVKSKDVSKTLKEEREKKQDPPSPAATVIASPNSVLTTGLTSE